LASTGVILGAIYMLWMYQRVFLGRLDNEKNKNLVDLTVREWAVLIPIMIFIVFLGVKPAPLLDRMEPAIEKLLAPLQEEAARMELASDHLRVFDVAGESIAAVEEER
jgi:NADH-quinone oxidoreductase subunit M